MASVMGTATTGCPWWSFHDPDVVEAIRAHDYWPHPSEWFGPDAEWWLIEAVRVFHRQLERSKVDAIKTKAINQPKRPAIPAGFEVMDEIRG